MSVSQLENTVAHQCVSLILKVINKTSSTTALHVQRTFVGVCRLLALSHLFEYTSRSSVYGSKHGLRL